MRVALWSIASFIWVQRPAARHQSPHRIQRPALRELSICRTWARPTGGDDAAFSARKHVLPPHCASLVNRFEAAFRHNLYRGRSAPGAGHCFWKPSGRASPILEYHRITLCTVPCSTPSIASPYPKKSGWSCSRKCSRKCSRIAGPGARISRGFKYHASGRCQTLPGRAHNLLEPSRSRPISPYGEGISVRLTRRPQPLAVAHHRLDEVCQVPRTKIARTFVGPECSTRCVSNNINNNINTRHALRGGTHIPRAVSGVYGWSRWLIRLSTTNSKL